MRPERDVATEFTERLRSGMKESEGVWQGGRGMDTLAGDRRLCS